MEGVGGDLVGVATKQTLGIYYDYYYAHAYLKGVIRYFLNYFSSLEIIIIQWIVMF